MGAEYGDGPTEERLVFVPRSVWGSANWTRQSRAHLELGAWSDDAEPARAAADVLDDLITFSEPLGSLARGPQSNLVYVEWDDDAMWEAMAAQDPWADDEP